MERSDLRSRIEYIHNSAYENFLSRNNRFSKRPFRYMRKRIHYHYLRDPVDLKDLHAYRATVIDEIFRVLSNHYPGTSYSDSGSTNITSDIDAVVFGPYKEEVKQDFNQSFEDFFKQDSSSLLDVNVYDVQVLSLLDDSQQCGPPFSIFTVKTNTEQSKYLCALDLRADPQVVHDQRAWALTKMLLHASEHEKQLLSLLSSTFPLTFGKDLEQARLFMRQYKRPRSIREQNRLYEKASFRLRDMRKEVIEDPTNVDLQRAYLHHVCLCGFYAQDAYFSAGAFADVVFLQQMGIKGYQLMNNDYVDSAFENFGDLCKAVHLDYSMICAEAVVDVSKYLFRTVHAIDKVYNIEFSAASPFRRIEDQSKHVKEKVRGKVNESNRIRSAADDIMKAINIPGRCNINELREKVFLLLFSVITLIYRPSTKQ